MSELTQADLKKLLPAEPVQPVEAHEGPVHVLRDSARGIGILISNAPLITAARGTSMPIASTRSRRVGLRARAASSGKSR